MSASISFALLAVVVFDNPKIVQRGILVGQRHCLNAMFVGTKVGHSTCARFTASAQFHVHTNVCAVQGKTVFDIEIRARKGSVIHEKRVLYASFKTDAKRTTSCFISVEARFVESCQRAAEYVSHRNRCFMVQQERKQNHEFNREREIILTERSIENGS